jgi:hypothetical protein
MRTLGLGVQALVKQFKMKTKYLSLLKIKKLKKKKDAPSRCMGKKPNVL